MKKIFHIVPMFFFGECVVPCCSQVCVVLLHFEPIIEISGDCISDSIHVDALSTDGHTGERCSLDLLVWILEIFTEAVTGHTHTHLEAGDHGPVLPLLIVPDYNVDGATKGSENKGKPEKSTI